MYDDERYVYVDRGMGLEPEDQIKLREALVSIKAEELKGADKDLNIIAYNQAIVEDSTVSEKTKFAVSQFERIREDSNRYQLWLKRWDVYDQFLNDEGVLEVLNKFLPEYEKFLPNGMYFPVPFCRSIKNGTNFSTELALKFHYDFIKTDENQIWTLNNDKISGNVLKLFQANLFFETTNQIHPLYLINYIVSVHLYLTNLNVFGN